MTNDWSRLKDVDNIYLIHEGRICESGTFEELLHRKGILAGMLGEDQADGPKKIEQRDNVKKGKLISKEDIKAGVVDKKCYQVV